MSGRYLRLAREATGISLENLAKQVHGVTAAMLGKFERDESEPETKTAYAIGKVLRADADFIFTAEEITLKSSNVRARKKLSAKAKAAAELQVLQFLRRYLDVENILDIKPKTSVAGAPFAIKQLEDVEAAAHTIRRSWKVAADGPIPSMVRLLEANGIKVIPLDIEEVEGYALAYDGADGYRVNVVVVNKNFPTIRRRFTLAHELGHLMLDCQGQLDLEKAAHRFAGAFLLPEKALKAQVGDYRDTISIPELVEIKRSFGVSLQMIAFRCAELGIVNADTCKMLFKAFDAQRNVKFDSGSAEAFDEEPYRFEQLCYRALAEKHIGPLRAAELLEIPMEALNWPN